MLETRERGKFIVLCGIDGCGKTTIIEQIVQNQREGERFRLMKHPPKEWYENDRVKAAFLDGEGEKMSPQEELGFTLNLRKKTEPQMLSDLQKGENLLFHRYIFSLFVYHVGMNFHSLEELITYYGDLLLPDKVIYLKISEKEFYKRFQKKEQLSYQKDSAYVRKVFDCYERLSTIYNWESIDTEKNSVKDTCHMVREIISSTKPNESFQNLRKEKYADGALNL